MVGSRDQGNPPERSAPGNALQESERVRHVAADLFDLLHVERAPWDPEIGALVVAQKLARLAIFVDVVRSGKLIDAGEFALRQHGRLVGEGDGLPG